MCLFKSETPALISQTSESPTGSGTVSGFASGRSVHRFVHRLIAPGGSKADARRRNVKEKKSNLEEVTEL